MFSLGDVCAGSAKLISCACALAYVKFIDDRKIVPASPANAPTVNSVLNRRGIFDVHGVCSFYTHMCTVCAHMRVLVCCGKVHASIGRNERVNVLSCPVINFDVLSLSLD